MLDDISDMTEEMSTTDLKTVKETGEQAFVQGNQTISMIWASAELTPEALIESILFIADRPVSVAELRRSLELSRRRILKALSTLEEGYAERGIRLQRQRR